VKRRGLIDAERIGVEFLSPRAREGMLRRCAKRRSHYDPTAGNGMRCARRGRGRFVQTTENPARWPGASWAVSCCASSV